MVLRRPVPSPVIIENPRLTCISRSVSQLLKQSNNFLFVLTTGIDIEGSGGLDPGVSR